MQQTHPSSNQDQVEENHSGTLGYQMDTTHETGEKHLISLTTSIGQATILIWKER
jgi:hypothetical protein